MTDALTAICADTRAEVARRRAATPSPARPGTSPRPFAAALTAVPGMALIAEIKRQSPSGGLIRLAFDPAALACDYARAGAACLSVLTDGPHFGGDPAHLRAARDAVALPVLRKDFMVDPWQVAESRAMGADCILLILAALDDVLAAELEDAAATLGMAVLAEVHDRAELDRALRLRTGLIGINNRNLKTLRTDLSTTAELARHVPPERVVVSESGIRTPGDVAAVRRAGARAMLVGESLLRQPDVAAAAAALLAA